MIYFVKAAVEIVTAVSMLMPTTTVSPTAAPTAPPTVAPATPTPTPAPASSSPTPKPPGFEAVFANFSLKLLRKGL